MCGLIGTNPGKMWLWITSGSGGLLMDSSLLTNTMLVCGALLSLFSGRCGVLISTWQRPLSVLFPPWCLSIQIPATTTGFSSTSVEINSQDLTIIVPKPGSCPTPHYALRQPPNLLSRQAKSL